MNLKNFVSFMQENIFRTNLSNYWRNIDKKIFVSFIILFFLGLFFSFSSTSSLAKDDVDEKEKNKPRKNKIINETKIFLSIFRQ